MVENSNWSQTNEDLGQAAKKIKSKINQEDLTDDLKESLKITIKSTTALLENILVSIDSTINDEEIKQETKDLFSSINSELKTAVRNFHDKVQDLNFNEVKLEEE